MRLALLRSSLLAAAILAAGCGGQARIDGARERVTSEPGSAPAWAEMGQALQSAGHEEEALAAYSKAMDLDTKDLLVYRKASELAASFGLFEEARIYADLGLYVDPADRECAFLGARARVSQGRVDDARKYLPVAGLAKPPVPYQLTPDKALLGKLKERVEGKYFVVRTDLDGRSAREVASTADLVWRRYKALFPNLDDPAVPVRIFLFSYKQDWTRMVGKYHQGVVEAEGLTIKDPMGGIRVISCMESETDRGGGQRRGKEEWLDRILLHELNHVAALHALGTRAPLWLMEGYAEYTAGASPRLPGFRVGEILRDRADVIRFLDSRGQKPPRLSSLLGQGNWKSAGFYEYAWSFVHFLHHGAGGAYLPRFRSMLERLNAGEYRAFERAFEGVDLGRMEREWHAYAVML